VLRPGDTTFALAHTSINADGVIQRSTAFTTIAATLAVNGSTYVITIKGTFTRTGFNAVVHLDVTQAVSPNRCAYDVNWVGSKNGSVNSLPVR
jgi:deoxyxylulose-5-phosphate synthase